MDKIWALVWAKTAKDSDSKWHPLILHMLDVAACADAILAREPDSTRVRLAATLGLAWEEARLWLLLVIASHDLGKASPGFQCKWIDMTGLRTVISPNTKVNHGYITQISLTQVLQARGWPEELAELAADAVGCHHGDRAAPSTINHLMGDARAMGRDDWAELRQNLVDALAQVLKPPEPPIKEALSGPDFMLLAGLTSFADWIGSNEEWFPFGTTDDCGDLQAWFNKSESNAERALDAVGWETRAPLSSLPKSFKEVFSFPPRPLQQAVAAALENISEPAILLVEAPMGEGKTEAAFFAHLELQRKFGHRGMYIALPSKATGNAMFRRTLEFLQRQGTGRKLDLQLLHGATLLNESFQQLCISEVHGAAGSEVRAEEWFTHKKRALLSEYGVGTVDQALLPILPVRHNFVRLWGLANRVVVFDEIHAYDAYTGTLLIHLVRWLLALGSSIVLLSATLPPSIRRALAGLVNCTLPLEEAAYPRISVFRPGAVEQIPFEADPARRLTLGLLAIPADLPEIRLALDQHLAGGGMGLALVNTVKRAQELFLLYGAGEPLVRDGQLVGKRLADGTEVYLFHARFPADQRQKCEDQCLEGFGPKSLRAGRKILVATQVAEQSLDLDFDLIVTDLAPIDLLLQRAGRLWRHAGRKGRPVPQPVLVVAGLAGETPIAFGKPLWWSAVYREDILLRTWFLLHDRQTLTLPDEIDLLVQAVYEDAVPLPDSAQQRIERALLSGEGEAFAQKIQANRAIIGLPGDASWNQPETYVLYDEDGPGLHRTLMAQTRLGDASLTAIPLRPDEWDLAAVPSLDQARRWYLRAVSISRKGVVQSLQKLGVPEAWGKSPLLRNCYPLVLNDQDVWVGNDTVRLDDGLGLVYQSKEAE